MCIGIPGKITAIQASDHNIALVDVCGIQREVNIAYLCHDDERQHLINQWVLVHVGFAMSLLDETEAQQTLALLQAMGEVEDDVKQFLTGGQDAFRG